jgi:hypothetical protein
MKSQGVDIVYDAPLDTLFVEIGGPKEALSEHVVDNIMVRVEPDTLEIVGVEILEFFSDFLPSNRLFEESIHNMGFVKGVDSRQSMTKSSNGYLDFLEAVFPLLVQSIGGRSKR